MRKMWQTRAETDLIPLHCMLEGLHGKVHLVDVLVLHKDAQVHLTPRGGGESVRAVGQGAGNQRKQVARLLERVLPYSKVPVPCPE